MDRLEEIRQRTEAGGPVRRIDMKYLLSEVDRLNALHKREIIATGEYAQRVIDLTARAEAAEAERDACKALWVYTDGQQCISCWKLPWRQRITALVHGRVWLSVLSGYTQPPVWMDCSKTVFEAAQAGEGEQDE